MRVGGFEEWYRREHPRLLTTMVVICGDLDVARDVTAEAFARALERWGRVEIMENPAGWTYTVALNLARRRWRRRAAEERLAGGAGPSGVATSEDAMPRRRRVPDLTDVLLRLVDPPIAEPDAVVTLERRVRTRRRRRRAVKAAVGITCAVAVGLPAFGRFGGREVERSLQLETSQTTVATVPPTPELPSGRFVPTWLPGDLGIQTEEERQAGNDEGSGSSRSYTRNLPTGVTDRLILSVEEPAAPLDVDRDIARYAGARRVDVQGRPGLLLPLVGGRTEVTLAWSPGPGQLVQLRGTGLSADELSTFAQRVVLPPRLDATPVPEGFRESIRRDGSALPPPTPRRYEVGTTPFRGAATNPASMLPAVHIRAMWDEPLTPGTPEAVRGRQGVLSTNGANTTLDWLERPGLLVTVTATNVGLEDVRRVAAGLREQGVDEVLRRPPGARVLIGRGQLEGGPYELWSTGGPSGPCLELTRSGSVGRHCTTGLTATLADLPISIGLGVAYGPVVPGAARVRLELAGGRTAETSAVGAEAGQGAAFYVVDLPPDFGRVVAVVALGPDGRVLLRTPV